MLDLRGEDHSDGSAANGAMNGLGIAHRDISPGNILVRDSDDEDPDFPKCMVIDFDASSLVTPGPEGVLRPLESFWKMDGELKNAPITVSLTRGLPMEKD